ncbi:hypothetical protein Tco_0731637 [Tanacetum coccineum]
MVEEPRCWESPPPGATMANRVGSRPEITHHDWLFRGLLDVAVVDSGLKRMRATTTVMIGAGPSKRRASLSLGLSNRLRRILDALAEAEYAKVLLQQHLAREKMGPACSRWSSGHRPIKVFTFAGLRLLLFSEEITLMRRCFKASTFWRRHGVKHVSSSRYLFLDFKCKFPGPRCQRCLSEDKITLLRRLRRLSEEVRNLRGTSHEEAAFVKPACGHRDLNSLSWETLMRQSCFHGVYRVLQRRRWEDQSCGALVLPEACLGAPDGCQLVDTKVGRSIDQIRIGVNDGSVRIRFLISISLRLYESCESKKQKHRSHVNGPPHHRQSRLGLEPAIGVANGKFVIGQGSKIVFVGRVHNPRLDYTSSETNTNSDCFQLQQQPKLLGTSGCLHLNPLQLKVALCMYGSKNNHPNQ